MTQSQKIQFNKRLGVFLHSLILAATLGWVTHLLLKTVSIEGIEHFYPESWTWLLIATSLVMVSLLLNGLNFHQFLTSTAKRPCKLRVSLNLHLAGQVVRYLPGRFWGLIYQIGAGRQYYSAANITRANIDLLILAIMGNLFISILILCIFNSISLMLGIPVLISILVFFILNLFTGLDKKLNKLVQNYKVIPLKIKSFFNALSASNTGLRQLFSIFAVFALSWILYLIGWACLQYVFPILENSNLLVLCAWYSLAWLIGFVSALTPAGLGVREAAFVLIASHGLSPDILSFVALFTRVWLILIDLALFSLLVVFTQVSGKNENEEAPNT